MFAYYGAAYFSYTSNIPNSTLIVFKNALVAFIVIYILIFYVFGIYKILWTFAGTDEFLIAIAAGIISHLVCVVLSKLMNFEIEYSIQLLAGIFAILLSCSFRILFRVHRRIQVLRGKHSRTLRKNALIVGGGAAGAIVIKEMKKSVNDEYNPVAVIDDDKYKLGTSILGVKVVGNRYCIEEISRKYSIDVILLAIPSGSTDDKKEILDICKKTDCRIQLVPGIDELFDDENILSKVRDVDVDDLLGREPVKLDMQGITDYIEDKVVLVTGGGGSIGSELCRQIVKFKPKMLIVLDIYENNAYDLQNELKYSCPDINLKTVIASVRDKKRLDSIFREYSPDVVFHAAAHKHVPLMEYSPSEAIKNNVFGTLNTAEVADKHSVKRFVLISTDKAVNPTNIMGASKRMCEMIVQAMDRVSDTEFVAVRFGNVLGSNGSVIPLFKKQIERGGPITVTHRDITRFFMTIPEAAQLVMQAGAYAQGGEVFVLDMGKPVKIYDLALDLIKLSGLKVGIDIDIEVTGLRPGEKLYEELLMDEEGLRKTTHNKIFIGRPSEINIQELREKLDELRFIIDKDGKVEIAKKISEIVTTYDNSKFVDEDKMLI
ncbi:nucleoside-diphosphate sugar epimerase/dehydratase [Youngiibacter multivorans]|nr:nucleoside-diphosphate sugar epimerase/dehydratase [Youngiibacter multivorans]